MERQEEQNLKSVLPQNIEIPKSYHRYLSYPVIAKEGNQISVQTPHGVVAHFELHGNRLKKLKQETIALNRQGQGEAVHEINSRKMELEPEETIVEIDESSSQANTEQDLIIERLEEDAGASEVVYEEFESNINFKEPAPRKVAEEKVFSYKERETKTVSSESRPEPAVTSESYLEKLQALQKNVEERFAKLEKRGEPALEHLETRLGQKYIETVDKYIEPFTEKWEGLNVQIQERITRLENKAVEVPISLLQRLENLETQLEKLSEKIKSQDISQILLQRIEKLSEKNTTHEILHPVLERMENLGQDYKIAVENWEEVRHNLEERLTGMEKRLLEPKSQEVLASFLQYLEQMESRLEQKFSDKFTFLERLDLEKLSNDLSQRLEKIESQINALPGKQGATKEQAEIKERLERLNLEKLSNDLSQRLEKIESQINALPGKQAAAKKQAEIKEQAEIQEDRPEKLIPPVAPAPVELTTPLQKKINAALLTLKDKPPVQGAGRISRIKRYAQLVALQFGLSVSKNVSLSVYTVCVLVIMIWQPWNMDLVGTDKKNTPNVSGIIPKNTSLREDTRGKVYHENKWLTPQERFRVIEQQVSEPEPGDMSEIMTLIASSDARERAEAAERLSRYKDSTSAGRELQKLLSDPDIAVRSKALRSLQNTGYSRAVDQIISIIDNRNEIDQIREEAIQALGCIGEAGGKPVADTLKRVLLDSTEGPLVRANAARALGNLNASHAEALLSVLDCEHQEVRIYAIESLGRFGKPQSIEKLLSVLQNDGDFEVKKAAALALGNIEQRASRIVESMLPLWPQISDRELKQAIRATLEQLSGNLSEEMKLKIKETIAEK